MSFINEPGFLGAGVGGRLASAQGSLRWGQGQISGYSSRGTAAGGDPERELQLERGGSLLRTPSRSRGDSGNGVLQGLWNLVGQGLDLNVVTEAQ